MEKMLEQLKKTLTRPELVDQAYALLKKELRPEDLNFAHSLRTGLWLKKMGLKDGLIISAALYHHLSLKTIRATKIEKQTKEELVNILKKVYQLRGLSVEQGKFKPVPLKKWPKYVMSQQAEALKKMFFAVAKDIRPILITLAGKVDEITKLAPGYSKEKQQKKSQAALAILAPLAYGLGMGEIKGQLEDAAFPYLYPKEHNWLKEHVKESYSQAKEHLNQIKPSLIKALQQEKISYLDVHSRAKHYFSLYEKLLRHDMDLEKIYDLVAMRVLVPNIEDCYRALGAVHQQWRPLDGRIKDYISQPKANGYRSLHTTVFCPHCLKPLEIQIKTLAMHQEAEYGPAAHFAYKTLRGKPVSGQHYWLNQLRQWQEEIKDPAKLSNFLQSGLFKNKIFALTPKNEVLELPKGSTPIDFAYAVHTDIGQHCQGAKVNNKMVSLKKPLQTGDVVEILTSPKKQPSSDWLRLAKTHKARQKIKNFLEKIYGVSLQRPGRVIKEKAALITKIIPRKPVKPGQILIDGQAGIQVKLAKCCKPKPQDEIIGFITQGQGASVHKTACSDLKQLKQKQPERIVQAVWQS